MVGELLLHALRVGIWLIYLIEGNHNGHTGGARMGDSFQSLGHYPIVCGDYQDSNIRYLSPVCTHCSKSFVTRGIEEGNLLTINIYLISADMLGYLACLSGSHVSLTDGVEKAGLTMVYMPHNGNYRRSGLLHTGIVLAKPLILFDFLG